MMDDIYFFDIVPKRKGILPARKEIRGTRDYLEFMLPILREAEYYEELKEKLITKFRTIDNKVYIN